MSDGPMEKIKKKMNAFKEKADKADDRATEAAGNMKEFDIRLEKAEEDLRSYKGRIVMVQKELVTILEKEKVFSAKLEEVEGKAHFDQERAKEIEKIEIDRDQKLNELEDECKEELAKLEETVHQSSEISRKVKVLESELGRATEKGGKFEKGILGLEGNLESAGENLAELEGREEESAEREEIAEEKLKFLMEQVQVHTDRAEDAERRIKQIERNIQEVIYEKDGFSIKIQTVEDEKTAIAEIANEVIDDDEEE